MVILGLISSVMDITIPQFQKYALDTFVGKGSMQTLVPFIVAYLAVILFASLVNYIGCAQATTVEEAQEEAQYVLQIMDGWELEMPVVFDWEQIPTWTDPESRTAEMNARTVTDCTVAFCEQIRAAGYTPMFYTNTHQYETFLYATEVDSYGVWAAQYSDRLTFPYYLNMWQYTDAGTVPGIEGEVDLNLFFPENILS